MYIEIEIQSLKSQIGIDSINRLYDRIGQELSKEINAMIIANQPIKPGMQAYFIFKEALHHKEGKALDIFVRCIAQIIPIPGVPVALADLILKNIIIYDEMPDIVLDHISELKQKIKETKEEEDSENPKE